MKYNTEVWFMLFAPGEKGGVFGYSAKLPVPVYDDEETEAERDNLDKELAQNFDKKLVDEVSRFGICTVPVLKRLAGWEAYTMKSSLEEAQFANAMLSLPLDHPASMQYQRNFLASLSRR